MARHATSIDPGVARAASLAMACFGLMASLPFLVPLHRLPLTSFFSEWLAALLGVLAILLLLASKQTPWQLPAIAAAPAALLLVVTLQWALGMFVFSATAVLVLLYLAWSSALMVAGRTLAVMAGERRLVTVIAWWLLAGGMVNGAIGICQQMQWQIPFMAQADVPGAGVYGNLAQQNHFATQMALSIASATYLLVSRQLARRWAVPAAFGLLIALALSASRSSILYLGWIAVMLALLLRQNLTRRTFAWSLLALAAAGLAAVLLLLTLAPIALADRVAAMSGAVGPRLFAWKHALQMFAGAPLLGVGFDAFAFNMVSQLERSPAAVVWGIDQYAHNLFLQLLAVSGVCGLLAIALPGIAFLRRQVAAPIHAERCWLWCTLGVLFIHSMLEQPLYYAYFLGLAALIAGMADAKATRMELPAWAGRTSIGLFALALVLLVKTASEYQQLETYLFDGPPHDPSARGQLVRSMRAHSLLGPIAELASPQDVVPGTARVEDKLRLSERARRYAPTVEFEFRHAALLAEAGQLSAAKQQFVRSATAYPSEAARYLARFRALAARDPATYGELAAFATTWLAR